MERWEHDAMLGYLAEATDIEHATNLISRMEKDIIFSGDSREDIINNYADEIGYDQAAELYEAILGNLE